MKISVIITLKKDVLDPQGQVIQKTLNGMGFNNVNEVRQGKFFEVEISETNKEISKTKKHIYFHKETITQQANARAGEILAEGKISIIQLSD